MNGNSMCTPSSRARQVNVQPTATMEMSGVALPPPPTCQHRSRPAKVGRTPQRNNTLCLHLLEQYFNVVCTCVVKVTVTR